MIRCFSVLVSGLLVALLVFTSGCTEGEAVLSAFGMDISPEPSYSVNENLILETEVIPSEVYEGEKATIYFDLHNRGNITVNDINLELTDLGELVAEDGTRKSFEELEEGESETWNWDFTVAEDIYTQRNQALRYYLDYKSNSYVLYDLVAMSHAEYSRLERSDRLTEEFNLHYFKTKSPVEIDLSISREQPVFEDSELYLYIDIMDVGTGSAKSISSGNLVVHYPDFLTFKGGSDFTNSTDENKLTLSRGLDFYDKETKRLSCKFSVKDIDVREIGQIMVETSYIYEYHKTINIKMKPK